MTKADDFLSGPVAAPDDAPSAAERAQAKSFAELVDKTLAGRTPPAMNADSRALLEVATVIRAGAGGIELAADRKSDIVERALRQALGARVDAPSIVPRVIPIQRARKLPWVVAGASSLVAAAAVLLLVLRGGAKPAPVASRPPLPVHWTSRPADALIGPIARERAGDASARIDTIFADRLDGYRERRLARGGAR